MNFTFLILVFLLLASTPAVSKPLDQKALNLNFHNTTLLKIAHSKSLLLSSSTISSTHTSSISSTPVFSSTSIVSHHSPETTLIQSNANSTNFPSNLTESSLNFNSSTPTSSSIAPSASLEHNSLPPTTIFIIVAGIIFCIFLFTLIFLKFKNRNTNDNCIETPSNNTKHLNSDFSVYPSETGRIPMIPPQIRLTLSRRLGIFNTLSHIFNPGERPYSMARSGTLSSVYSISHYFNQNDWKSDLKYDRRSSEKFDHKNSYESEGTDILNYYVYQTGDEVDNKNRNSLKPTDSEGRKSSDFKSKNIFKQMEYEVRKSIDLRNKNTTKATESEGRKSMEKKKKYITNQIESDNRKSMDEKSKNFTKSTENDGRKSIDFKNKNLKKKYSIDIEIEKKSFSDDLFLEQKFKELLIEKKKLDINRNSSTSQLNKLQ
ncbi:hypothetical protein HK099_008012 [Clydaea vesicula]|uniref:Uncharacterized protein n=1 Tax=Clydaea vesicula TaxID=447962 RepID=A0AAD5TWB6_9FUNG|nr:hypothetical protein HK099_008012 [Clydaea vesicula]